MKKLILIAFVTLFANTSFAGASSVYVLFCQSADETIQVDVRIPIEYSQDYLVRVKANGQEKSYITPKTADQYTTEGLLKVFPQHEIVSIKPIEVTYKRVKLNVVDKGYNNLFKFETLNKTSKSRFTSKVSGELFTNELTLNCFKFQL